MPQTQQLTPHRPHLDLPTLPLHIQSVQLAPGPSLFQPWQHWTYWLSLYCGGSRPIKRVIIWVPGPHALSKANWKNFHLRAWQLPVDKVQATCPKAKVSPTGMWQCHALWFCFMRLKWDSSPKKALLKFLIENWSKKQFKPYWNKPIILLKYMSIRLLKYFNKAWISISVTKINNLIESFQ